MMSHRTTVPLAALAVFLLTLFAGPQPAAAGPPEKVHTHSFKVPIGPGQHLFVTEHFTFASKQRKPARAAIFLTGPEFRGNFWTIPVEGYNGPKMAAQRGFFAYTFDYVGVPPSHVPTNGTQINYLTQVDPVRKLVDFVRRSRQVDTVDLIGEGYGAEIATELADEPERVRSVTLTVVIYKTYDEGILAFLSPELEAFLRSFEDGYYEPDFYLLTLGFSPVQEVRDYVLATQPGTYPTGPALQFWDFPTPIIDAPSAVVPGLVITGELDPFPAPGDSAELAADWGGGADLVVIEGAHHVPRIEAPEIAEQYFEALVDFIDP